MAVRLPDTAEPMGNFAGMMAKHIECDDGERLQDKIDNGSLGGGGGGYTQLSQAEYDALTDDEKMNGKEYRTYDTGHIYKLGIEYGKDAYFTSLSQLGLTAPTTVGEVFMAMPNKSMAILSCEAKDEADGTITISDIPVSYGVLIIKKNGVGRFSIEYQNSSYNTSSNVKKWIGTLKGADGTGLKWKEVATMDNAIETIANPTELDTNKFLKSGYYSLGDASNRTNLPMQNVGTLLVYYAGHYVIQEYILNANLRRFMRRSTDKGANWSTWKELATMDKAIENVPPTSIELNADYFTSNDDSISMYEIRNGICYVTMDVTSVVSTDVGRVVCTLPKPSISKMQFSIPAYGKTSTTCMGVLLYGNGKLTTFSVEAGQRYMHTFSYPVAQ